MRLTFYGAAEEVTGSNYLLEFEDEKSSTGTTKILIDCGLHQGKRFCERHNYDPFPYKPEEISAVVITHAHIDHTGRIPKLVKEGFKGKIYSTPPTRDFAQYLLLDSQHLLAREAQDQHLPLLYKEEDVERALRQWEGVMYHEPIILGKGGARITLHSAGHILGSATIVVEAEGKRIMFSGDLGNSPAPLIGPSEAPEDADYCLIESAYGDRVHEDIPRRYEKLEEVIVETIKNGGTLLIPAFALERTQILLLEIKNMLNRHGIPRVPIYLDSPLAIRLTSVYQKYRGYFREEIRGRFEKQEHIFDFPTLHKTLTTEESKKINEVRGPKIIIAGAGMSNGGRILHHERRYLSDPKSALLIFGYQAHGTMGRQLLDGAPTVKIMGEEVPVRAKIKAIGAYSAHADQNQLLNWARPLKNSVKKFFVVQGEAPAAAALAKKITSELHVPAEVPKIGETVDLV